jgi:hypothetical protein
MTLLENNDDQIVIDPNKNYLQELVGDGKKFKDLEELAKGKYHADATIELYKKQMDSMRADYLKEREENITKARLEEMLDKLRTEASLSNSNNPAKDDDKPVFDPKQIESLVSSKILEHDQTRKQEENYNLVKGKLLERYGANYKEALTKQVADLGLSAQEVENMARTNPKVFIKAFGLEQPKQTESFQPPVKSSVQAFMPTGTKERTWSFYQDIKKKDKKAYYAQETQQQMMADYNRLGEAFEDGDFHQT